MKKILHHSQGYIKKGYIKRHINYESDVIWITGVPDRPETLPYSKYYYSTQKLQKLKKLKKLQKVDIGREVRHV